MARILIIEDEERIASFLDKGLRAEGHRTAWTRPTADPDEPTPGCGALGRVGVGVALPSGGDCPLSPRGTRRPDGVPEGRRGPETRRMEG